MKIAYLILILIFQCSFTIGQCSKEESEVSCAQRTQELLKKKIQEISVLDEDIRVAYYSTFLNVGNSYSQRLQKVLNLISDLKKIEDTYKALSENNRNEKDYLVKLAYTDVAIISICYRKMDFLDFLKFDDPTSYKRKIEELNALEFEHIKLAKSRVNLILKNFKDEIDAMTINILLTFYEKGYEKSIQNTLSLIEDLEKTKNQIGESSTIDSRLGSLYSWLAYSYIQQGDTANASKMLYKTLTFNEPIANIQWARNTIDKLLLSNKTEYNSRIVEIEKKEALVDIVLFEQKKDAEGRGIQSWEIKELQQIVKNNPSELMKLTIAAWKNLAEIEQQPWDKAKAELEYSLDKGSALYKRPDSIYVNMDNINKGFSTRNKLRYFKRLYDVQNYVIANAIKAKSGWSNLVLNNPDIWFYRIYRIKNNLILYYLNKNAASFINILQYFPSTPFPLSKQSTLKSYFENDPTNEINEDLVYLENKFHGNVYYLVTKAECAIFMNDPVNAFNTIESISKNISQFPEFKSNLEIYKSYLYFKQRDISKISTSIQILGNLKNTDDWLKNYTSKYKFLLNEKEAINLKKK